MKWHTYVNIDHVSGIHKKKDVLYHIDYLMRREECAYAWSNTHFEQDIDKFKAAEKQTWALLNDHENRVNSRLQSRLVIPLPNSFNTAAAKTIFDEISALLNQRGNVHASAFLHRGSDVKRHRDGAQNLHLHIVFSERDHKTFQKIRELKSKQVLQSIKEIVSSNIRQHGIATGPRQTDLLQKKKISYKIVQQYRKQGHTEHREYQEFLLKQALQQQIRTEIRIFNAEKKRREHDQRSNELDAAIIAARRQRSVLNAPNMLEPGRKQRPNAPKAPESSISENHIIRR